MNDLPQAGRQGATWQDAEEAIRTLIRFIGDDPEREGLRETPERVIRAWADHWGKGYRSTPTMTLFNGEGHSFDTMVLVRRIQFYSHCEHHLAPFFGTADIAYLPEKGAPDFRADWRELQDKQTAGRGIIGLSKLARIVRHFGQRLQVQERMTAQIADYITQHVTSEGCGVVLRARHMCMMSRGVEQAEAETVTSALRGEFFNNAETRQEFLNLCGGRSFRCD